jgi:4'-phosphopantetheinyl transferase
MDEIQCPSPDVRCLLQSAGAHPALEGGFPPDGVLAPPERERWEQFKVAKRRHDWLMGRWTAKRLVQEYLSQSCGARTALDDIVIDADPDGAPYVALAERGRLRRLTVSLSISHTGQLAFCALCDQPGLAVGADVERVEARDPSFAETFFSAREVDAWRAALPESRDLFITAIWGGKEAALKSLRVGLRADTRRVQCCIQQPMHRIGSWTPMAFMLDARLAPPMPFGLGGWWRSIGEHVLALALLRVPPAPQDISRG